MNGRRTTSLAILAAMVSVQTAHSGGPPEYEVTAIIAGFQCGDHLAAVSPYALNEAGDVVGFVTCSLVQRAFRWTADSGLELIPMPGGTTESQGVAINGSKVVGTYSNPELELGVTGFLYDFETDQFTSLGTLPGGNWSEGRAINSTGEGEIVGFWGDVVNGPFPQAFIWREGEMIDIHPDFGTPRSRACDINANSQATGWMGQAPQTDAHAFIWNAGNVVDLGLAPNSFSTWGNRINDAGDVLLRAEFTEDEPTVRINGLFVVHDGVFTDLGALPGYDVIAGWGLNNDSMVVGMVRAFKSSDEPDVGFIWRDGVMRNLNDLIAPGTQLQISQARGINESGQIAAMAHSDDLNATVGLLLSPIQQEIPGDLDDDGQVGVKDLLILLGSWGPCDQCGKCPPDLNGDCVVGVDDLLILLGNWG